MRTNGWLPTVFNDIFDHDFMPKVHQTAPAINVLEDENNYSVELAAPGAKKEDFNVEVNADGDLRIKMESKEDNYKSD